MVLQQGQRNAVWGWADDGEAVTVEFNGAKATAQSKDGRWMVKLPRLKAGETGTLRVNGNNTIELTNVAVGEVWLCSGQSNVEFPLSRASNADESIASCTNTAIRFFQVAHLRTNDAATDVKGRWEVSSPSNAPKFTAVGYFFGRDVQKKLNVPIGLIQSAWGGTPCEAWTPRAAIRGDQKLNDELEQKNRAAASNRPAKGKKARQPWVSGELYNGMIAPVMPYGIKGVIWYQGEANASRAAQYRRLFPLMIQSWRKNWDEGAFPFLAVQLAPYDKVKKRSLEEITSKPEDSDWAELREAQLLAARNLPKAGLAVITDVGEKDDIHPKKKEPVGDRLAAAAEAIAYGENVEYSGPIYRSMKVRGNAAILSFDHVDGGLESRGGDLTGFAICGEDRKFGWAKAVIDGDKVVVKSSDVSKPVAVRYGWADFPVVNLWNKAGFPASPFRTDDFPMITSKQ